MGRLLRDTVYLLCLLSSAASAQTLAHRNWAGSGMTPVPWWQGAELYRIDPISFQDSNGDGFGDLRGLTDRLDYLQTLGIDALVLSPFPLQPGLTPIEPTYGTDDGFNRLIAEATRRHIRVLADLPLGQRPLTETLAAARFLLSRGVAGLCLTLDPAAARAGSQTESVRELRRLEAGYPGQRVLLWDAAGQQEIAAAFTPYRRAGHLVSNPVRADRNHTELTVAAGLDKLTIFTAATVKTALLAGTSGLTMDSAPAHVTDTTQAPRSLTRFGAPAAKALAAILLAGSGDPMLLFGQEIGMASAGPAWEPTPMQWGRPNGFTSAIPWLDPGPNNASANVALEDGDPDSLLNWYRKLADLRRTHAALRTGSLEWIDLGNPEVAAWIRCARTGEAALVIVNASAHATMVSLARLGEVRSLAASYPLAGAVNGGVLTLPAYGVTLGEFRRSGGLENVALPPRRRRH